MNVNEVRQRAFAMPLTNPSYPPGYKHKALDLRKIEASLAAPSFVLKIIPHVDCSGPRVCELVRYYLTDVAVKGAWSGPAAFDLHHHALAPVADLPVLEVVSAVHIMTDLTLGLGEVVHDYLQGGGAVR